MTERALRRNKNSNRTLRSILSRLWVKEEKRSKRQRSNYGSNHSSRRRRQRKEEEEEEEEENNLLRNCYLPDIVIRALLASIHLVL
jgi:hypothetical protein